MQPPEDNRLSGSVPDGRRNYDKPKSVIQSRTILCSIAGMVASIAGLLGYSMAMTTLIASFGAFVFRLLATRRIG